MLERPSLPARHPRRSSHRGEVECGAEVRVPIQFPDECCGLLEGEALATQTVEHNSPHKVILVPA